MKIYLLLFILGLISIILAFFSLSDFYKMYKGKLIIRELYEVDTSKAIGGFDLGFWATTYSLSKILHQWWQHRITYLIVMIYAILVYFAYQYIIKKFKVNDIINYSFSKGISYIYLIVALYQFYRFLTYG